MTINNIQYEQCEVYEEYRSELMFKNKMFK